NAIRPLFTQWRRSSETPPPPSLIDSAVRQSDSYDDSSTFAHTSAATAAASRTAAPPVSVRRNSRSGVFTLRAHAVRPVNGDASFGPSELMPPSAPCRQVRKGEPVAAVQGIDRLLIFVRLVGWCEGTFGAS